MIIPNKYSSQARTLKLHMNLYHNHHRGRVTTLQRSRSMTLLPKISHKTNLFYLVAAVTIYALIVILITQKCTDIDVCKKLFKPLFVCYSHSLFFSAHTSFNFCLHFFYFLRANPNKYYSAMIKQKDQNRVYNAYKIILISLIIVSTTFFWQP